MSFGRPSGNPFLVFRTSIQTSQRSESAENEEGAGDGVSGKQNSQKNPPETPSLFFALRPKPLFSAKSRKMRKGQGMEFPGIFLCLVLIAVGCSSPKPADQITKKPIPPAPFNVNLGPGKTTAYSTDTPRRPLWNLKWDSARVETVDRKQAVGEVRPASGEILPQNQPPIPFEADRGNGDQPKQILNLIGSVKLVSKSQDATLLCDELRYDASAKIVIAKGNVRVVSPNGTLTTDQELWATPDLRNVGTKQEFLRSQSSVSP